MIHGYSKLHLREQLDLVKVRADVSPPLQKASSVLKQLKPELEHIAPTDHSHANDLSGQMRVVSRVVDLISFVGAAGSHGDMSDCVVKWVIGNVSALLLF